VWGRPSTIEQGRARGWPSLLRTPHYQDGLSLGLYAQAVVSPGAAAAGSMAGIQDCSVLAPMRFANRGSRAANSVMRREPEGRTRSG
jgi:hypothetical protein